MRREPRDIESALLVHAPWNPRASITPASVEDLTASIRTDGLIQRIVVIPTADARYYVIAGNRRLVACREAGLESVPCEVLDVDERTAKRMTLLENLQRQDADPILEADLIAGLTADGMTIEEIAAETGRGEKWVWRRQQLIHLSDGWRQLVDKKNITVDCLEHVASYPEAVQKQALEDSASCDGECGSIAWCDVRHLFARACFEIKNAPFRKDDCKNCSCNSANAPMLFDFGDAHPKFGECLSSECFEKKKTKFFKDAVSKAEKRGERIVRVKSYFDIPNYWKSKNVKSETNSVLYVVEKDGKVERLAWSVPPVVVDMADREADKAAKAAERARKKAYKKLVDWLDENDARFQEIVRAHVTGGEAMDDGVRAVLLGAAFGMTEFDGGCLLCKAALEAVANGWACCVDMTGFCGELKFHLKNMLSGYERKSAMLDIVKVFPEIKDVIPPDDVELMTK